MKTRRRNLAFVMLAWAASASVSQSLGAAEPTLVSLDRDPLLVQAIFQRLSEHPDHHVRYVASGASSSNIDFEQGEAKKWFIESQRYGGDLVETGLLLHDRNLAEMGWKILDWGFARQTPDGGFGDTGDPFHSTSFFVESAARSLLISQELNAPDAARRTKQYGPKLRAAAHWMLRPEVLRRGLKNNEPYTHRRWLVAAAWGMAARVTGDTQLRSAAAQSARDGLALQQPDGVNPEKGGFDVSYQAVGLLLAARYYTVCDDQALRTSIATMLARGLTYETTKISARGQIETQGSTRITSETGRSGAAKTVDNKVIVLALVYGARLLDRPDFYQSAEKVVHHLRWIKP